MKHSKKILTASIALLLGASGLVLADHFVNEHLDDAGFEVDTGGWTPDGSASRVEANARTGTWSMSIGDLAGSASQTVDGLDECSPYGLATFELSGFYDNPIVETVEDGDGAGDYASVAGMTVQFNLDDPFATSTDVFTVGYVEMTLFDNIPAWATSATITIDGMPHDNTHDGHTGDDIVDVHWDDMAFMTDCVVDYAKVSGKLNDGEKGNAGQNGQYSFSGAIGTLESDPCGTPVGEIHINYKTLGYSCVFRPELAPTYYNDGTAQLMVEYDCTDDVEESFEPGATIVLTQGAGGSNKNKDKDRGMISVSGTVDGLFDIPEGSLRNGNVNLSSGSCPVVDPE